MKVIGAWHTGFSVADLDRSLGFYRDLLGLELLWERTVDAEYLGELVGYPGVEIRQAMLAIPGSDHTLELNDYCNVDRAPVQNPQNANPGTAHICLIVDDLQALHARLAAADVAFLSEPISPTVGPNVGNLVVYGIDPDGIRLELLQRRTR